ncbi:MAG: hypothetical protein HC858_11785 [Brachymonas sp.]|nr:hypothetical protein [Brachymonas sp.]
MLLKMTLLKLHLVQRVSYCEILMDEIIGALLNKTRVLWKLTRRVLYPCMGTQKDLKVRGGFMVQASVNAMEAMLQVNDDMEALCQETRMVQPKYFVMEIQRRKDRGTMSLRWRSSGRRGTSLMFQDVRVQMVLKSLPVAMQRQYANWEVKRVELNVRALAVCAETVGDLTVSQLKQMRLAV